MHRRGAGWYSHGVLAKAVEATVPPVWRVVLNPVLEQDWANIRNRDDVAGMLCNIMNVHWACATREGGHVFYVDSQYSLELISETEFKAIITRHPMSFMVIRHDSDLDVARD